MTNNICKEKNCEKEIQAEEEYCHYHKKKHSEKKEKVLAGILTMGWIALVLIAKGKSGSNKS